MKDTEACKEINDWVEEHDGEFPVKGSSDKDEHRLGQWITTRRNAYREGRLDNKTIAKYEKIDGWNWGLDDLFQQKYNKYKEFVEEEDRLPTRTNKNKDEKELAVWARNIKTRYIDGKLSDERIKMMEKFKKYGWSWDKNCIFFDNVEEVINFVNDNDGMPSRKSEDVDEKRLGNFINHTRTKAVNGKLTVAQLKAFSRIPDIFFSKDKKIENKIRSKIV
jgi:hypothetical protein